MPINILMPALSPTMEKGNLSKWLKREGDRVKSGDVIAEIETDKATMEVEAADEGTLAKIVVPEGTADVPVNQVIAVLAGEGEDVKAAAAGAATASARAKRAPPGANCTRWGAGDANRFIEPNLRFAAGAQAGERSRHRCCAHPGLGAARPCHCPRHRSGEIGQGTARRAGCCSGNRRCRPSHRAVAVGPANPRAL
jgi:pyruvate/2-oxoglutarate dehydrogenase complex dihydrolipoamide acyltransferase (E2) component